MADQRDDRRCCTCSISSGMTSQWCMFFFPNRNARLGELGISERSNWNTDDAASRTPEPLCLTNSRLLVSSEAPHEGIPVIARRALDPRLSAVSRERFFEFDKVFTYASKCLL